MYYQASTFDLLSHTHQPRTQHSTVMAHHAASTSRAITRALEAMEGKPEEELAALHRLKTVFAKHAGGSGSSTATNGELLTALAKAILDDGANEFRVHTSELDASHPSCVSSPASAPFKCPTRRFGRTELQMPILTLGGMRMQQTWQPSEGFSMADVTAECQSNFEAIIARALQLGINHIETAKGYGSSELQYGQALRNLGVPRSSYILQTKVRPMADTAEFSRTLDQSFAHLGTHLDLFGFHGINRPEHLEWITRPGGCLEVVREYQHQGKIKFIGFSTHAPTPVIVKAIETGIFDYVNLHYHAIGSYTSSGTSQSVAEGPGNWEALRAAHRKDMGVFIISAADKGGMLYRPPKALVRLCSPLSPLIYNMLWLWNLSTGTTNPSSSSSIDASPSSPPAIHTLVIGAARPSDFNEAAAAAKLFFEMKAEDPSTPLLRRVDERLQKAYREVWGEGWEDDWWMDLPDCYQNPFGVHVAQIVWMWSITKAYGLHRYSTMQYSKMEGQVQAWEEKKDLPLPERMAAVFDWTPGLPYDPSGPHQDLTSFLPAHRAERLLCILREASYWFGKETTEKVELDPREKEGWVDAYDLQLDVPFPERVAP